MSTGYSDKEQGLSEKAVFKLKMVMVVLAKYQALFEALCISSHNSAT